MQPELHNRQETRTISLKRHWQFPYGGRRFRVYIDQEQIGRIANGALDQYTVRPGEHTIQIKIDFYSSTPLQINIPPHQDVRLRCGQNLLNIFNFTDYLVIEDAETTTSMITSTAQSNVVSTLVVAVSAIVFSRLFFIWLSR